VAHEAQNGAAIVHIDMLEAGERQDSGQFLSGEDLK
jgi:hypothetical protein